MMDFAAKGEVIEELIPDPDALFDTIGWGKEEKEKEDQKELMKTYLALSGAYGDSQHELWEKRRSNSTPNFRYEIPTPGFSIGDSAVVEF
jgi:hypothetical protein